MGVVLQQGLQEDEIYILVMAGVGGVLQQGLQEGGSFGGQILRQQWRGHGRVERAAGHLTVLFETYSFENL